VDLFSRQNKIKKRKKEANRATNHCFCRHKWYHTFAVFNCNAQNNTKKTKIG